MWTFSYFVCCLFLNTVSVCKFLIKVFEAWCLYQDGSFCLQDQLMQQLAVMNKLQTCVEFVHQQLRQATNSFQQHLDSLDIKKLESIAQVRFAFAQAAVWMHQLEIEENLNLKKLSLELKRLFSEMQLMCENVEFDWPRFVYDCYSYFFHLLSFQHISFMNMWL